MTSPITPRLEKQGADMASRDLSPSGGAKSSGEGSGFTPVLREQIDAAILGLNPLTGYGEDAVWRPADRARSALIAARDAIEGTVAEEFLEFKEALSDIRSLRQEHRDLNGGGPGWTARNAAAWATVDELFANEDEAAWCRQQEDAHG